MHRLASFALVVALGVGACGGGVGAPGPDGGTATGAHHHYVADKIHVPKSGSDVQKYGLDVGSATGNTPDGTIDNKLGTALVAFGSSAAPDGTGSPQIATDTAVAKGGILLLVDLQTADFTTTSDAGFRTLLGTNPMPTPCADPTMVVTCGRHLTGSGSFDVASSSPNNGPLTGAISAGTFSAGPGNLTVQLAIGSPTVATINLVNAHVRISDASTSKIGSAILAGVITQADVDNQVLPSMRDGLLAEIARDCGTTCQCVGGSTGAAIESLYGTCAITVDALKANANVKTLIAPDVCTSSSCSTPDGLSFGVEVTAVPGTFSP